MAVLDRDRARVCEDNSPREPTAVGPAGRSSLRTRGPAGNCDRIGACELGPPVSILDDRTMEIPKPTEADMSRFRTLIPSDPRVEIKPMSGNLGAFVNGNMFMGLFGPTIGFKLPESDCEILRRRGAKPFGPAERPMGGYLSLPAATGEVEETVWASKALDFVGALPAKEPKPAKR